MHDVSRDQRVPPGEGPGLPVIGWREWLSLPALGLPAVKVKIDTGARTSALHAYHVERVESDEGTLLRMHIHPLPRRRDLGVCCEAPLLEDRLVRDSGGHEEIRPVIRCPLVLGTMQWDIDITVTNRDNMRFRMLLGRTALRGRVLIDPGTSYCLGRPPVRRLYGLPPKRTRRKSRSA